MQILVQNYTVQDSHVFNARLARLFLRSIDYSILGVRVHLEYLSIRIPLQDFLEGFTQWR